jgi:hypothetical protein
MSLGREQVKLMVYTFKGENNGGNFMSYCVEIYGLENMLF